MVGEGAEERGRVGEEAVGGFVREEAGERLGHVARGAGDFFFMSAAPLDGPAILHPQRRGIDAYACPIP